MSFSTAVTSSIWNREEKGRQQWKRCILSHSHSSCNHLLFPLVTSALAKFMWPLLWPLTSMEKHLFEGKDSWHNPTSPLLMWFMLNQKNSENPWALCDSRTGRVGFIQIFVSINTELAISITFTLYSIQLKTLLILSTGLRASWSIALWPSLFSQIWPELIWTASNIKEFVLWLLRLRLQVRLHIDLSLYSYAELSHGDR